MQSLFCLHSNIEIIRNGTSREFAVLCQEVSRKTLIRDLNELVKRGIVKQKGRKKGIHYVLS